ncbi:MAG: hypothetical protein ACP5E5_04195 [Acidobacteriaceae bacterium]
MRFCRSVAVVSSVLLGLGCAIAARAQAGVYLGFQATRLSGITCFDPQGECSDPNHDVYPQGLQVGGYYDFRNIGPIRLGIDVRGGTMHSYKSASSSAGGNDITVLDNVLAGVRGSFRGPYFWLNPYAQVSVGYARSNATLPFGESPTSIVPLPRYEDNFVMYEGFIGDSVRLAPWLDLRPIELGIGNMNRFGNSGAPVDGPSSIGVISIGASVVLHMPTP